MLRSYQSSLLFPTPASSSFVCSLFVATWRPQKDVYTPCKKLEQIVRQLSCIRSGSCVASKTFSDISSFHTLDAYVHGALHRKVSRLPCVRLIFFFFFRMKRYYSLIRPINLAIFQSPPYSRAPVPLFTCPPRSQIIVEHLTPPLSPVKQPA